MQIVDCAQGSAAWFKARVGIPTASGFDKLITAKTMKPSASATGYLHEKLAEWMLGQPLTDYQSSFMQRGSDTEEEAVNWYELTRDADTQPVGFIYRDDRMAGCSPDRLVGPNGLLEIKCPAAKTHVGYLLGSVADDYRAQVQGQMYISERAWCDTLSYCPGLPPALVRVERDEPFIQMLASVLDAFILRLLEAREVMIHRGYVKHTAIKP